MQKNQMKIKLVSMLLAAVFVFVLLPGVAIYANDSIRVSVDGQYITFTGQHPVVTEGRTLVPLRAVFEQMGFDVGWESATRQITLTNDRYTAVLAIGSNVMTTNDVRHTLDTPPQIINDTTMLPIRAVLESVGYFLQWDSGTSTILISSSPIPEPTPSEQTSGFAVYEWDVVTIQNPAVGLSLRIPHAWVHDESDKDGITVFIEGNVAMRATRTNREAVDAIDNITAQGLARFGDRIGTVIDRELDVAWVTPCNTAIIWLTFEDMDSRIYIFENHDNWFSYVAGTLTVTG